MQCAENEECDSRLSDCLKNKINNEEGLEEESKESNNMKETGVEEGVDIFFMDDYFTDIKSLESSQLG